MPAPEGAVRSLIEVIEQWRNDVGRTSHHFWIMGATPASARVAFAARVAHYGQDKVNRPPTTASKN